ncbi:MAG: DNA-binding response regulator [Clostridium saudiense]|uniref:DNA-binding response regulator n=1 Tax=Clostridium saudiense TaxID=1414720 RepID=UPI00290F1036|nr:DNA-binding response regulator [Clostridium saudiense]MDU3523384.1 DNA-binding response regulator [Clostridium saudiense]
MGQAARQTEIYTKSEIQECSEILQYIYFNNDECFVRVLNKITGKNKSYPINSLKDPIKLNKVVNSFGKEDILFSLNPFRTMDKATRSNLFCINAIPVDIDYKNIKELKELDPYQVIKLLEMDFFERRVPTPNFVEYGNQLRLIYSIETCYVPKFRDNVVTLARRISEVFAQELKEFGAEKQNLESYFRIPGSINTKNGVKVKIYSYDESVRYTLSELQELWLDELPKWYKKRKGRVQAPKKVVKLHNVYAFNCNRLRDLEKIQSYLNSMGIIELRARLCFQYRNYTLIKLKYQNGELKAEDYEFAREEMLKFNNNFNEPLRPHIIESATRVVNYRQYLYKNETMLRFFNDSSSIEIDYELCEKLGLESIFKVKTQEEWNKDYYKKKLKVEGKVSEQEKLSQRRQKIKALLEQGFKQKDICLQLDISKRTYIRDRNYLKEQGLI